MKHLFVVYLLLMNIHIYSQDSLYLYGPNCFEKRRGMGIEITQEKFDSLLVYTENVLMNTAWSTWKVEDCITMIRIYNTIWIKRLNRLPDTDMQNRYERYRAIVRGMMDPIWWAIEPKNLDYSPIINYRSLTYNIETFGIPGPNSYYAVLKKEKN